MCAERATRPGIGYTALGVAPIFPSMDESWVLVDAESGLHVGWYFWLRVLDEVNRAARYGAPFGLLMLDADVSPGKPAKLADDAVACVSAAIRNTDLGGALGSGSVAVLLPHQDVEAAEIARTRILERLAASCPDAVTWKTEMLCYPRDGARIANLLSGGWELRRRSAAGRPA